MLIFIYYLIKLFYNDNLIWIIFACIIAFLIKKIQNKKIFFFKSNFYNKQIKYNFFIHLFKTMGHLCKSKGYITKKDINFANYIIKKMIFDKNLQKLIKKSFYQGKKKSFQLKKQLKKFFNLFYRKKELIYFFFKIQIQTALLDGYIDQKEQKILYIIAKELHIHPAFINIFLFQNNYYHSSNNQYTYSNNKYTQNNSLTLKKACLILGIQQNDDNLTIKRAYKKLMSKHHPDKMSSKKFNEKDKENAKIKTQKIQEAYNFIKKQKNFR